jgi:peptide/nickel transport system permease protein
MLPPHAEARPPRSLRRTAGTWALPAGFGALVLAVIVGPAVAPADPAAIDPSVAFQAPSLAHWFGTDQLGRDVFSRWLHGGRTALLLGILAVTLSTVISTLVGLVSALCGGRVDAGVNGLLDILLALPGLLITLAILGVLGPGFPALVIALVGASWVLEARIIRSAAAPLVTVEFVQAATALGGSLPHIVVRHILPNLTATILILATINLGEILLVVSALSFLGIGVQPPATDWGTMLADSVRFIGRAPWLMVIPGVSIVVFAVLANLMGDRLGTLLTPGASR